MSKAIQQVQETKNSLLKHFAILFALCTLLQAIMAVRGSQIDVVAQLMLAVVAVYVAGYHYFARDLLRRMRFGWVIGHAVAFMVVTLSYHVHALVLYARDSSLIQSDGTSFTVDRGWYGILVGLTTFWGIGFLMHLVSSIASRGFEELPKD